MTTDPTNCGSCGHTCTSGQTCCGGTCCSPANCCNVFSGAVVVSHKCVDFTSDPNNCGSCGNSCTWDETCSNGLCCPAGLTNSGRICCPAGQTNCAGICCPTGQCCGSTCCQLGQSCCNGQCTGVSSDVNNCGSCGNRCPSGLACGNPAQAGYCTGLVSDSELNIGDVLVFVPVDPMGAAIDLASGLYGYSHVGIVGYAPPGSAIAGGSGGGLVMFDVNSTADIVPRVELVDLQSALKRGHVGVRFPLTPRQSDQMLPCLTSLEGEQMDWLELVTFGALNEPGTELCTTLVTHCLDQVGFNRTAMGLAGFVSPNHIARAFHAPKGRPFGF